MTATWRGDAEELGGIWSRFITSRWKGIADAAGPGAVGQRDCVRMQTVRQPDATRGRAANFWYEVRMRDSKKEELRRILFKEKHPLEKLKRIGLGALTVEGFRGGDTD